ncbi:tRNA 2-thiouridine(34) synthase MnmA [bacterium]|nr:tRNA 2-thiouridine(34) synthase MnmA [bacterium]
MLAPVQPRKGSRIVVAMSGGVDSSVAAGWLKQQGYDVIGISLQLHDQAQSTENKFGTCCSISDIQDARTVAEKMGIPFYVANMEDQFEEAVIDNFVGEYLQGRTPNPCVKCNEKVKFSRLMDWAMDLGADYLATGHYAQIYSDPETGKHELARAVDPQKDQSYFLFTMRPEDLPRTIFPVGGLEKAQVRELASQLGLMHVAQKPDSQEICFVQAKSYREFIEERVPASQLKPGRLLDPHGVVLGQHTGLHQFTIGQRKGLGVFSPDPLYVLEIRPETGDVVVGPESCLFRKSAVVAGMHWIRPFDPSAKLTAKIRYRASDSPVEVSLLGGDRIEVRFLQPQRAITPGQALVLYDGQTVLGGGWIESLSLDLPPERAIPAQASLGA